MRLHLGNLSLIPCTVENATIDAASCKFALFMKLYYLNQASLHETESIITFLLCLGNLSPITLVLFLSGTPSIQGAYNYEYNL